MTVSIVSISIRLSLVSVAICRGELRTLDAEVGPALGAPLLNRGRDLGDQGTGGDRRAELCDHVVLDRFRRQRPVRARLGAPSGTMSSIFHTVEIGFSDDSTFALSASRTRGTMRSWADLTGELVLRTLDAHSGLCWPELVKALGLEHVPPGTMQLWNCLHDLNAADLKLTIYRADDFFAANMIMSDIWNAICGAGVVVADCTGKNPNVFYELGIAHTVGKPVILITQESEDVPFDLRHIRYIKYDYTPPGMDKFEQTLTRTITETLHIYRH